MLGDVFFLWAQQSRIRIVTFDELAYSASSCALIHSLGRLRESKNVEMITSLLSHDAVEEESMFERASLLLQIELGRYFERPRQHDMQYYLCMVFRYRKGEYVSLYNKFKATEGLTRAKVECMSQKTLLNFILLHTTYTISLQRFQSRLCHWSIIAYLCRRNLLLFFFEKRITHSLPGYQLSKRRNHSTTPPL